MKYSTLTGRIAALAFCLLWVPALASPMNPVERPFKLLIQETVVMSLLDFTWQYQVSGQATHLGFISGSGAGSYDVATDVVSGAVTYTAANGDQITWELESPGGGGGTCTIIAGTGRFEHASGFFVGHLLSKNETWDFEAMTVTVTYLSAGEGRISY
jgi:hypothetical protein